MLRRSMQRPRMLLPRDTDTREHEMTTTVDVFFSANDATSRYKIQNAWVYWRVAGATTILRSDARGLISSFRSGPATSPASYTTPFYAETDTVVELAYSSGAKPAPESSMAFVRRKVKISLSALLAQSGPRRVDSGGRVTSVRALPLAELRLPEVRPLPMAVGVVTADVARPPPGTAPARAMSFLLHRFAIQNYEADWTGAGGAPGEHRAHGFIAAAANRGDLVTATVQLAEQLAWRGSGTRRIVWAVGHGFAGNNTGDEASFDMAANALNTPNRVFAADVHNVVFVMNQRQTNPTLSGLTIPAKVLELEQELTQVRDSLEENRIGELLLYGCRVASSNQGQQLVQGMATILSAPQNPVRVGAYSMWLVAREPRPGDPVEVGGVTAHAHLANPALWVSLSQDSLLSPEVWR